MMPHTVTYDERGFILIEYHGSVSMADVEKIRALAISLSKQHDCKRSLTDFRDASFDLSTLQVYELPRSTSKAYEESGLSVHAVKRALVVDEGNLSVLSFLETVSINNSQDVRLFHELGEAQQWLLDGSHPDNGRQ